MKSQYDFSKAERGKFYHPDTTLSFPVYLAPDVSEVLVKVAEHRQVEVQDLVNDLLRADIKLIRSVQA